MSDSPSNPTDSRRISTRQKNNKALQAVEQAASSKQAASSSSSFHGVSNTNKRKLNESTSGTNDDDHVGSKKAVQKLTENPPNELSKYFCHGCNKDFPEFKSNREFIKKHHTQVKGDCLASCFICPLATCKSVHYNMKGLMLHYGSCTGGCNIYNVSMLTNNRISAINSTQMTLKTVLPVEREQSNFDSEISQEFANHRTNLTPNQRNIVEAWLLANPNNTIPLHNTPPDKEQRDQSPTPRNDMCSTNDIDTNPTNSQQDLRGVDGSHSNEFDDMDFECSPTSSFDNRNHSSTSVQHTTNELQEHINEETKENGDSISADETEYANSLLNMKDEMKNNIDNSSKDIHFLMAIELEILLRKAGAPLYLFDDVMKWGIRNRDNFPKRIEPISRKNLYKKASAQMYGKLDTRMRPFKTDLNLPSGRNVTIVKFQLLPILFSILECPYLDLSNPKNLIFDGNPKATKKNPFKVLLDLCERYKYVYDDIETSVHYQETLRELMLDEDMEMYVPILKFIDEALTNGMTSHSMEPDQVTVGIAKRPIRNDPKCWRTLGFVENPSRIVGGSSMTPAEKQEDYHFMLSFLFEEMKAVISSKGLLWKFKDDDGVVYPRRLHFRLMFIIGDTKGADNLVGRFGSHWNTKGLSRDCDIPTANADDPHHACKQFRFSELDAMKAEQLQSLSMRRIENSAFRFPRSLMGASPYGICAGSPPEPLHVILLGIMIRLYQFFKANLTAEQWKVIQSAVSETVVVHMAQGKRSEFPDCCKFTTGNIDQGHLSGKQKYARIFIMYLVMLKKSTFEFFEDKKGKKPKTKKKKRVIKKTTEKGSVLPTVPKSSRKKMVPAVAEKAADNHVPEEKEDDVSVDGGDDDSLKSVDSDDPKLYDNEETDQSMPEVIPDPVTFSLEMYGHLVRLLEETLSLYQWLTKKGGHAKIAFLGGSKSAVAMRLIRYMDTYKTYAPRYEGMGLKLYKFHAIKKWYFYICLFGSPLNSDSSRLESGHIENLKMCGRRTQQRMDSINWQTSWRYYEKVLISRIAMLFDIFGKITKYEREKVKKDKLSEMDISGSELTDKIGSVDDNISDDCSTNDSDEESVNSSIEEDDDSQLDKKGPYFRLTVLYDSTNSESTIRMQWLKGRDGKPVKNQSQYSSFDATIMEALRAKLENYNGGKESRRLFTIDGASEFKYSSDGTNQRKLLIRAVPSYRKGNSWNDYVLIPWEDEGDEHLPAKILVILDYDTCTYEDLNTDEMNSMPKSISDLLGKCHEQKKGIHMVVHSASSEEQQRDITSSIVRHFVMEKNKFQLIPADRISGTVFAVPDEIDYNTNIIESILVVKDMEQWSTLFFDYEEYSKNVNSSEFDDNVFSWDEIE